MDKREPQIGETWYFKHPYCQTDHGKIVATDGDRFVIESWPRDETVERQWMIAPVPPSEPWIELEPDCLRNVLFGVALTVFYLVGRWRGSKGK